VLDVLVSGISGGVNDYVFPPAQPAPANIFTLNRRISKTIPATTVVDSRALRKLYASPVTLARFEADSGTTSRGLSAWCSIRPLEAKGRLRLSGSRRPSHAEEERERQAAGEAQADAQTGREAGLGEAADVPVAVSRSRGRRR
jgi:hypothetical protein